MSQRPVRAGPGDRKEGMADLRQTPTNLTLTAEQFERLYLSPKTAVSGELQKTFGNPTPVAVVGLLVALTPYSIALLGWRGAGGGGVATQAGTLWFGGFLMTLVGFLDFILGNTFSSIVFFTFGAHFLTTACTFIPWFNSVAAFAPAGTPMMETPTFLASYAFYLVCMTLISIIFLICSVRTNVVFVLVFFTASVGFGLASAGFWALSKGDKAAGDSLIVGTGAFFFTTCMFGWYLLLTLMLGVMDLPTLPIFDLSTKVRGVSERTSRKRFSDDVES